MKLKNFKFYDPEAGDVGGGSADDKFEIVGKFDLGQFYTKSDEPEPEPEPAASAGSSPEPAADIKPDGVSEPDKVEEKPVNVSANAGAEPGQDTNTGGGELSLEDLLKGRDKREVLKALNVSEEVFDALESATTLAELSQFLDVRTRDWDKVSDQDVLREDMERKYKGLDPAKFEKLFAAKLKAYNLESLDDEEKELGQIQLEIDAKEVRDRFKADQPQFKLPERTQSPEAQQLATIQAQQAKAKADLESFASGVRSAQITKDLIQSKRVEIGDGYHFEVEPEQLIEAVVDTTKMFAGCIREDGTVDLNRVYKIVNYALNTDKVESAYQEHYRGKETDDTFNELVNPSKRDNPSAGAEENETLAQALANRGTHTSLANILHQ